MDAQTLELFDRERYIADVQAAVHGNAEGAIRERVKQVVLDFLRRCTCLIANQEVPVFAVREPDGSWKLQPITTFFTRMGVVEIRHIVAQEEGQRLLSIDLNQKMIRKFWEADPLRSQANAIDFLPPKNVFVPAEPARNVFNTYAGPGVTLAEALEQGVRGSPSQVAFERYLREEVCNNEEETFRFVASWMAHQVQRPGKKCRTALVLTGRRGAGKSTICELLIEIVGRHNCVKIKKMSQITDKFNAVVCSKVVVMADDVHWPGDMEAEAAIKPLITDEHTTLELKGKDPIPIKMIANVMFVSNGAAVGIGEQERRFGVAKCSEAGALKSPEEICEFRRLIGLDVNGEEPVRRNLVDVARWLYEFDISRWTQAIPKHGAGLQEQVAHSLRGLDAWWHEILEAKSDAFWGHKDNAVKVSTVKNAIEELAGRGGLHKNEITLAKVRLFLRKVMKNSCTDGAKFTFGKNEQARGYQFVPWADAVREFGQLHNMHSWAEKMLSRDEQERAAEEAEFS